VSDPENKKNLRCISVWIKHRYMIILLESKAGVKKIKKNQRKIF
jgi:hypothetical protein